MYVELLIDSIEFHADSKGQRFLCLAIRELSVVNSYIPHFSCNKKTSSTIDVIKDQFLFSVQTEEEHMTNHEVNIDEICILQIA